MKKNIRTNQKGAATIEAIVSFSGFLFVIFTILNIVNFCRAQMLISNAMDTVTKELTQYSYFYQVSGLQKFNQKIQAIGEEGELNLNTVAGSVGDLYQSMSTALDTTEAEAMGLSNSLQEGTLTSQSVSTAIQNVKADGTNVLTAMNLMEAQFEGVADNPVLYLKSIVAVAGSEGLELAKSHALAAPLAKALIIKHFGGNSAEADARLKSLGVVDGLDGMKFGMSTIFTDKHPDEIHLAVYYKLKIMQLFKWADFEASICKETRARAWLGGDDVQIKAVSTPAAAGGSGEGSGRETPATPEETPTPENPEEATLSAEQIKANMIAKYGQEVIDAVSVGEDTSAWTEDDWEYRIWLYQNSEKIEENIDENTEGSPAVSTLTGEEAKNMAVLAFGADIVARIAAENNTSSWTLNEWIVAVWCYQHAYQNQSALLIRMQMVEWYGEETVNAVSKGMNTTAWTSDEWEERIGLYLRNKKAEEEKKLNTDRVEYYLSQSRNNSTSDTVILGSTGEYDVIGKNKGYTYFKMSNELWAALEKETGSNYDEIWKVNQQFIDEQVTANKTILLSNDPYKGYYFDNGEKRFYQREIDYIVSKGYTFEKTDDGLWKAVKK